MRRLRRAIENRLLLPDNVCPGHRQGQQVTWLRASLLTRLRVYLCTSMTAALGFVRAGNPCTPLYAKYRKDHAHYCCRSRLSRGRDESKERDSRACGAPIMRADKLDAILDHFFSTRLEEVGHSSKRYQ